MASDNSSEDRSRWYDDPADVSDKPLIASAVISMAILAFCGIAASGRPSSQPRETIKLSALPATLPNPHMFQHRNLLRLDLPKGGTVVANLPAP